MFIVEHEFVSYTIHVEERPVEYRYIAYDKFENALAEYRRLQGIKDLLGNPAAKNLKLSKATLVPMDIEAFL